MRRHRRLKARSRGFTLVELVVVMCVVAILAAFAYPSYEEHQRKSRRAAAQAFLVDTANRQSHYLLDARQYAVGPGAIAALSLAVPPEVAAHYVIAVEPDVASVPPAFRIVATPLAGSAQVPDGDLVLDHEGARSRGGQPGW